MPDTISLQIINAMPPKAIIINVARGGVVDREALVKGLTEGKLGGFGTDVFWLEPFDPQDADQGGVTTLRGLVDKGANIVMTPHVAGVTMASYGKQAEIIVDNICNMYPDGI